MRMSLKEKHLKAIEEKDFLQKECEKLEIKILDDDTGSFWHKKEYIDFMKKEAKRLDNKEKKDSLYGLNFGVKDLFCIDSMRTTAGSKILENFKSPYTSTLVQTLQDKDGLIAGKLAMDEFAMGSYSNTSFYGRVSLPFDKSRTAGGSSGGSAAALPILDFTLGSDTGGSVRLPASFCGYVGYKPSYGVFSFFGMISYASSLDQAGLLTHSVEDLDYLMKQDIVVQDVRDRTCLGKFDYVNDVRMDKVGYFPEILNGSLDSCVKKSYEDILSKIPKDKLVALSLSTLKYATQIYYIIACSEAASNLARYQGVYFGKDIPHNLGGSYWEQVAQYRSEYFGVEVQKRIMLGSYITSSENFSTVYEKAVGLRKLLKKEFEEVFEKVDTLVLPVAPFTSPSWDVIDSMTTDQIYMADYMTVPFSLAGIPAISMPLYKDKQGLPIGMQFVGKQYKDGELISKCLKLEKEI